MKLDILFENGDVLVLNKPFGLIVNRSETTRDETLQDLVGEYLGLASGELGVGDRAGIVHRLDRETSGVIVIAKTAKIFEILQNKFKNREVKKKYIALVHGLVDREGEIIQKIARVGRFGRFGVADSGRESATTFKKVSDLKLDAVSFEQLVNSGGYNKSRQRYLAKQAEYYSLVDVFPKTGRTHQIRVHFKHIGHPLVSDAIYCPNKLLKFDLSWCPRLFLHAASIELGVIGREKNLKVHAPLPLELGTVIKKLCKV